MASISHLTKNGMGRFKEKRDNYADIVHPSLPQVRPTPQVRAPSPSPPKPRITTTVTTTHDHGKLVKSASAGQQGCPAAKKSWREPDRQQPPPGHLPESYMQPIRPINAYYERRLGRPLGTSTRRLCWGLFQTKPKSHPRPHPHPRLR